MSKIIDPSECGYDNGTVIMGDKKIRINLHHCGDNLLTTFFEKHLIPYLQAGNNLNDLICQYEQGQLYRSILGKLERQGYSVKELKKFSRSKESLSPDIGLILERAYSARSRWSIQKVLDIYDLELESLIPYVEDDTLSSSLKRWLRLGIDRIVSSKKEESPLTSILSKGHKDSLESEKKELVQQGSHITNGTLSTNGSNGSNNNPKDSHLESRLSSDTMIQDIDTNFFTPDSKKEMITSIGEEEEVEVENEEEEEVKVVIEVISHKVYELESPMDSIEVDDLLALIKDSKILRSSIKITVN